MNIENFIEGKIKELHKRKSAAFLVMVFFFVFNILANAGYHVGEDTRNGTTRDV